MEHESAAKFKWSLHEQVLHLTRKLWEKATFWHYAGRLSLKGTPTHKLTNTLKSRLTASRTAPPHEIPVGQRCAECVHGITLCFSLPALAVFSRFLFSFYLHLFLYIFLCFPVVPLIRPPPPPSPFPLQLPFLFRFQLLHLLQFFLNIFLFFTTYYSWSSLFTPPSPSPPSSQPHPGSAAPGFSWGREKRKRNHRVADLSPRGARGYDGGVLDLPHFLFQNSQFTVCCSGESCTLRYNDRVMLI